MWDCYKTGLKVYPRLVTPGMKYHDGKIKRFLRNFYVFLGRLTPIDYVRWRELSFAFNAINKYIVSPKNILDISSPKLLPLTIAKKMKNCIVYSTDILEQEVSSVNTANNLLKLENLVSKKMDARLIDHPDNSFDLITTISVLEHIAPEKEGEIPAAKEINRVLSPGGIAVITVPFSKSYFAEYKQGTVYERQGKEDHKIFFQRFYDMNTLMRNIVEASSLELVYLGFIEERFFSKDPHKRLTQYISGSSFRTFLFGPFYPILSRIFLSKPKELRKCNKPYLACLILKKS
jgi:predicted SAM-dependent methyltransferase